MQSPYEYLKAITALQLVYYDPYDASICHPTQRFYLRNAFHDLQGIVQLSAADNNTVWYQD